MRGVFDASYIDSTVHAGSGDVLVELLEANNLRLLSAPATWEPTSFVRRARKSIPRGQPLRIGEAIHEDPIRANLRASLLHTPEAPSVTPRLP